MCTSAASFTGVVPLQLLLHRCCTARMLLKFRGSAGWTCPSLCFTMARPHNARTRTNRSTVRLVSQNEGLERRLQLLLYRGCHNVKNLRCDRIWHTAAPDKMKKERKSLLRPGTMETRRFHKKLEFQRYPPKDFCTARYARKSSKKKFQTFQKPRKKTFLDRSWAKIGLR